VGALAAAIMATGAGVVAVPPPARADICPDYQICSPPADTVVQLGFTLFRVGRGGITPEDLEKLILTAIGLMQTVQADIISHTDNVLVQNTIGRMRTLLIEARNYQRLRENEILLWNLYDKALTTMNDSYSVFRSVTDRKGKDDAARAVLVEYPIAVAALGDYGQQFDPSGSAEGYRDLEDAYIASLKDFRAQLTPDCHVDSFPSDLPEINQNVVCVAATGRTVVRNQHWANGKWITGPVNVDLLKKEAAIGSAWLEAVQILENLGQ
jgi:hypothetical protein